MFTRIILTREATNCSLHSNLDAIVDGLHQILLRAEVTFGGLNTRVSQQQLNLFQIPSGLSAKLGASPPQIMRG